MKTGKIFTYIILLPFLLNAQFVTFLQNDTQFDLKDTLIVIQNATYDPQGTTWTWKGHTQEGITNPHRDLGQSFTTHFPFILDKIFIEIDNESMNSQADFEACKNTPVHIDILTFAAVGELIPTDTISSQGGKLTDALDSTKIKNSLFTLLGFDIENIALEPEKVYAFLLKFDEIKPLQKLNLNKTHAQDFYPEGAMLFVNFDGSNGREKVTVWDWQHPGSNTNRDLNFYLIKASGGTGIDNTALKNSPQNFELYQNYPNPFNPITTIQFFIKVNRKVELYIFDTTGKRVNTLLSNSLHPGSHQIQWDGTNFNGQLVANGIYYYQLKVGNESQIKKLTFLK